MVLRLNHLFLFIITVFILSTSVFSQNLCSLTIKVLDEETSENVRNANVFLDGPRYEKQSADMGSAIFTSVSPGSYTITVKADGYYDKTGSLTLDPSKKKDYSGTFRLKPAKTSSQEALVQDKKNVSVVSATLTIKIVDADSGDALNRAAVEVSGTLIQKKEAVNGIVVFDKIANGSCGISVSADGYETKSGKIEIDSQKKLEYSGTFKLIKQKQAVSVHQEISVPAAPAKVITEPVKEKTQAKETKKTAEVPRAAEASPIPAKPVAQSQTPAAMTTPSVTQPIPAASVKETWYSPFLKPAMITASVVSGMLLIALFLGLFIKWSEMTGMVKAVSVIGALGCGTLTLIIIIATIVMSYSLKTGSTSASGKSGKGGSGSRIEEVKKIFTKSEKPDVTLNDVVFDDAASKHELGSMIFMKAVKDNNAQEKEKGVALLEEAFRTEPGNALYTIDLADAYVQMNTLLYMKLATDLYRGLLEEAPENDKLLARTADAYARMYQYDKAFQFAARRAWSGKASPVNAASQIALISLVSGNFDRGISEVSKMIRVGPPETPELKLILAGLYGESGSKDKAGEILDGIIASLPGSNDLCIRAKVIKGSFIQ